MVGGQNFEKECKIKSQKLANAKKSFDNKMDRNKERKRGETRKQASKTGTSISPKYSALKRKLNNAPVKGNQNQEEVTGVHKECVQQKKKEKEENRTGNRWK